MTTKELEDAMKAPVFDCMNWGQYEGQVNKLSNDTVTGVLARCREFCQRREKINFSLATENSYENRVHN